MTPPRHTCIGFLIPARIISLHTSYILYNTLFPSPRPPHGKQTPNQYIISFAALLRPPNPGSDYARIISLHTSFILYCTIRCFPPAPPPPRHTCISFLIPARIISLDTSRIFYCTIRYFLRVISLPFAIHHTYCTIRYFLRRPPAAPGN